MSAAYQQKLARIIRACGETLVEDAEKIAGQLDLITETDIIIQIPANGTGFPAFEVRQGFASHRVFDAFKAREDDTE